MRQWEEDRRFEELDSDDTDGQGVGLNDSFTSDQLLFTGADLGRRSQNRRNYAYGSSGSSDDEEDDGSGGAMQLALRDKEEMLVQRALERIRRAQMLGHQNVELTRSEIDALERKRQKDEAQTRKSGSRPKLRPSEKRSDRFLVAGRKPAQQSSRKSSRTSLNKYGEAESSSPGLAPPGFVVPGPDGQAHYAPLGYYPAGSRSTSSHGQQSLTPPLSQSQFRNPAKRYSSVPEQAPPSSTSRTPPLSRALPDDPNWIPRPRSASSNQSFSTNAYPYPPRSPPLPQVPSQYSQGRRIVSGPAETAYPIPRRPLPTRPYAASSEASIQVHTRGDGFGEEHSTEDDAEEDDDDDDGVQVDVVSYGQGYEVNMSGAAANVGRRRGRR